MQKSGINKDVQALRASVSAQSGKGWAVVIGIQKYEKATAVRFSVADAKAVADMLTGLGFQVATLYDEQATKAAIEHALGETLKEQVKEQDRLVVFFAGHTDTRMVAGGSRGFLLPVEGDPGAVAQEAIGMERLRELTDALPARQVVLLVDASLGGVEGQPIRGPGTSPAQNVKAIAGKQGRHVIAAAGADQQALEAKEWERSVFTYYLLEGLGKAQADLNRDGVISTSELYGYLDHHVTVAAQVLGHVQRPKMWAFSEGEGQLLFLPGPQSDAAASPLPPPPAETPASAKVHVAERELKVLDLRAQELETRVAQGLVSEDAAVSPEQQLAEARRQAAEARTRYQNALLQSGLEIIGNDGAPMVLIPPGEFLMGEDTRRYAVGDPTYNYAPKHQVYLDAFYMDKYEVTTARYAKFLEASQRPTPRFWSEVKLDTDGDRPVIGVRWEDADAYCNWVGKRLPTEAEWEKAARGPDGRKYPWGDEAPSRSLASYDWPGVRFWQGYGTLSPVGSYEEGKSPYGIYDLAGNVWEWVADWYNRNYYLTGPKENPKGPATGKERVVRGGSWRHAPELLRSSYRNHYEPSALPFTYLGFRCAKDLPK
jgi:formylglycine-generating enzyme required for sulfatase activity